MYMKLLELFKGTGSVGKAATQLGYTEIVSLDIEQKFNPTILSDIMTWDYKTYPPGYFDVVWASPPCTAYSSIQGLICCNKAKKGIPYDLEALRCESDLVVAKVLEIINYFNPTYWIMENPQSGALKRREVVQNLDWCDADYCKYGYPYRKRTRFWNNFGAKLTMCKHDCPFSVGKRHITAVASHRSGSWIKNHDPKYAYKSASEVLREMGLKNNQEQRYSIPQDLLLQLLPKPQ
jgi:site-specific DNA-cytosine methylase